MRHQRKALLTAALAAAALAVPTSLSPAAAATTATRARPAVAPRAQQIVTLVTGDQARLSQRADGTTTVLTRPGARSGVAHSLATATLAGDQYVIPKIAQPYLGTVLDPALFNVTRQAQAAPRTGRTAVRLSFSGARPSVPGVTITSSSAGAASGYIAPESAATFRTALLKQWTADARAGFPARTSLFGATRISAVLPGGGVVSPSFPMVTLIIKAIGPDGKPARSGFGLLGNVDDMRKYGGFIDLVDGEARVSVPKGTYSGILDVGTFDETTGTGTDYIVPIGQYAVTGANQTLTFDMRRATATPSAKTPKPASTYYSNWLWQRIDAPGTGGLSWGSGFDDSFTLKVAPTPAPAIGSQDSIFGFQLLGPGTPPAYAYDLAQRSHDVPANARFTFTAATLGTTVDRFFTDGDTHQGSIIRYPSWSDAGLGGAFEPWTMPGTRTGYVGAIGPQPLWQAEIDGNDENWDDPSWTIGQPATLAAGTTHREDWLRAPIASGIPVEKQYPYCWACRTATGLSIGVAGVTDSDPGHMGVVFGAIDGLPVARFRLYQDDALVFDGDDYLGTSIDVPAAKATYRAVADLDRRLTGSSQSTRISTEFTFASAGGQGPLADDDWFCDIGDGTGCRVLPVVQAKLALPTSLSNTLPAGRSAISVTAGRINGAAASAVRTATVEVRYPGDFWQPVTLTAAGAGRFTGTLDNTGYAGQSPDVRITATDAAGSTFKQTILKAYTVAGA